jgi:hypothetical protein
MALSNNPILLRVRDNLRVTKVVCTRSVKGKQGDHYVGFSAAWDTIQDDAGGAADLISAQGDGETKVSQSQFGMTLKESRVAAMILGMQADLTAHDHSMAGGNLNPAQREEAGRAIRSNYTRLIAEILGEPLE